MSRLVHLALAVTLLQTGCWKSPQVEVATAPSVSAPATDPAESVAPASVSKESAPTHADSPLTNGANESPPEKPVEAEAADSASAPVDANSVALPAEPAPPERFLLFTPRGPLLVHLNVLVNGVPLRAAADAWLARVATAAGATSEREVTWTELVAQPRVAGGRLGNTPLAGDKERADAIRQFDLNRDGRAQSGELAALFANNPASDRPFELLAIADSASELQNGPLYALFDVDRDGRLSAAEIESAAARLQTRDADDNEVVAMADVGEVRSAEEAPRGRADNQPDLALDLAHTSPDEVYYTLGEIYNESGRLDAGALDLVPSLLKFLDVDDNGAVDAKEVARLEEAPPSLVLTFDFAAGGARQRQPQISVSTIADELSAAGTSVRPRGEQVDIELPGVGLELSAVDVARTAVLDDVPSLFTRLDADKSGLLEASEQQPILGATNVPLAEIDTSGDGKLSLKECQTAAADSQPYSSLQTQARVAHAADALFAWLDQQRDGRLTSREIRGAAQRLGAIDRDGDGQITPDEVPPRLTLVVSRGAQARINVAMQAGRPSDVQGPAWMSAMDRNRDGEISPREFLGTRQQFTQLDADGDGFLSAQEASAAASGDP